MTFWSECLRLQYNSNHYCYLLNKMMSLWSLSDQYEERMACTVVPSDWSYDGLKIVNLTVTGSRTSLRVCCLSVDQNRKTSATQDLTPSNTKYGELISFCLWPCQIFMNWRQQPHNALINFSLHFMWKELHWDSLKCDSVKENNDNVMLASFKS